MYRCMEPLYEKRAWPQQSPSIADRYALDSDIIHSLLKVPIMYYRALALLTYYYT